MSIFGSVNQVTFGGYVGGDTQFNMTGDGLPIVSFSIAIDGWDNKAKSSKTMWMRISAFGKLAETCEKWINKGTKVVVSGRLDENAWNDKEGNPRKSYQVIATDVVIVEKSKMQKAAENSRNAPPESAYQDNTDQFDPYWQQN